MNPQVEQDIPDYLSFNLESIQEGPLPADCDHYTEDPSLSRRKPLQKGEFQ